MEQPEAADTAAGGSTGDPGGSAGPRRVLSWLDEDELPQVDERAAQEPAVRPDPPAPLAGPREPLEAPPVPVGWFGPVAPPGPDRPDRPGGLYEPYGLHVPHEPQRPDRSDGWSRAGAAPRPPAGRRLARRATLAAALVTLASSVAALVYVSGAGGQSATAGKPPGRVVSAPLAGVSQGEFELHTSGRPVTVRGGDLAGDLYRIAVPAGSGAVPKVERSGNRLTLRLVPEGAGGAGASGKGANGEQGTGGQPRVDVQLAGRVSWNLRFSGGSTVRVLDATRFDLRGLAVSGGSTRVELFLPRPPRRVPIRLADGVGQLAISLPPGAAARLSVGGGAGRVTIDGRIRDRVTAGRVLGTIGWQKSPHRYEIEISAGVSTIAVRRRNE